MTIYRGRTLVFVTTVIVVALGLVALAAAAVRDTIPPITTDDYDGLWHSSDVNVTLRASDQASGVAATYYSWNTPDYVAGTSAILTAKPDHTNDGIHTLTYYSEDAVGNRERPRTRVVKIDTRAPITRVSGHDTLWHRTPVVLTFSADDQGKAGIAVTQYRIDRRAWKNGTVATVKAPMSHNWDGRHIVRFRSRDTAGNVETAKRVIVRIDTRRPRGAAASAASAVQSTYASWRYRASDAPSFGSKATIGAKTTSDKVVKTGDFREKTTKEALPSSPRTGVCSVSRTPARSWRRRSSTRGSACATAPAAASRPACASNSPGVSEPTAAATDVTPLATPVSRCTSAPSGGPRREHAGVAASATTCSRSAIAKAAGAPPSVGSRTSVTERSAECRKLCRR